MGSDIIVISDDEDEVSASVSTTPWPPPNKRKCSDGNEEGEGKDGDNDVVFIDKMPCSESGRSDKKRRKVDAAVDDDCCVLSHDPNYKPVARSEVAHARRQCFQFPLETKERAPVSVLVHGEWSVAAKQASLPHQYEGKEILPQFHSLFLVSRQFAYDVQVLALDLASVSGTDIAEVFVKHETLIQDADFVKVEVAVGTASYVIVFGEPDSQKIMTEVDCLDNKVLASATRQWLVAHDC